MGKKIMLLTLQGFSTTGGIQKMTRTLGHSLSKISEQKNWDFKLWSAYDTDSDLMPAYVPLANFKGFGNNRTLFVISVVKAALKCDVMVLTHVNLAFVGWAVKKLNPACEVWLIAHGIEVWRPFSLLKRSFLKLCDKVVCVSNFTREQMINRHHADPGKCHVLNNAVDPFMKLPKTFDRPEYLLKRYNLSEYDHVVFTLTRLSSFEQYKGYEQVIRVISTLKTRFPLIKYVLSGKHDKLEEVRINKLISSFDVADNVILTGFIKEDELPDHFLMADLFVLPSKKEGFGIVFIEALACGLPVICGNQDGSVDAICNGELGTAIDVDDLAELERCMIQYLDSPLTISKRQQLQNQCLYHFNEDDYINKLHYLLDGKLNV